MGVTATLEGDTSSVARMVGVCVCAHTHVHVRAPEPLRTTNEDDGHAVRLFGTCLGCQDTADVL